MEWTAHCGCRLTCGEDGEPTGFVRRCEAHQEPATPADVAAENRAMSLARKALEDSGVPSDDIVTEITGADRHGRAHGLNGETAEVSKVSLTEYLEAHPHAAERFAKGV
jgi:hypothetical protein